MKINPAIKRLVDSATNDEVERSFDKPIGLSKKSGKPIVIEYEHAAPVTFSGKGIWRYAPLLPVLDVPAGYAHDVGGTDIIHSPKLDLFLKCEGTNPSGSFKDRGLAVGVALGVACGAKRFCLPTQGNAGIAAAMFSARLGLPPALVYMPASYEGGVYAKACAYFGGTIRFFGANIAASGKKMREDLAAELSSGEYVDISTFFEPGRLEGKKTMGLEIWEHFGEDMPDWLLYPTGGGTGLVGIWKALQELRALGMLKTDRLPRMVAVQSERCAPVVKAFEAGLDHVVPVESQGTIADGLDVPGAIMGHRMLAAIRESKGTACAVTEDATKSAFTRLGREGIPAGYESAALVAAFDKLQASNVIAKGSKVLALITSGPAMALSR